MASRREKGFRSWTLKLQASFCLDVILYLYTDQFSNRDALVAYPEIGHELEEQFSDGFDAYCGSYGTAGIVMGVPSVLEAKKADV